MGISRKIRSFSFPQRPMMRRTLLLCLGLNLLLLDSPLNLHSGDFLVDQIKRTSLQTPLLCPAPKNYSFLLAERGGGCFSDCFLNPFGSEECDACRTSASDPMPEWTTKEKILWSIGSLLLAGGMIWLSSKLNQGSNCVSAACSGYYGGDPYNYYSNPYYGGNYPYGTSAFKIRPIKPIKR